MGTKNHFHLTQLPSSRRFGIFIIQDISLQGPFGDSLICTHSSPPACCLCGGVWSWAACFSSVFCRFVNGQGNPCGHGLCLGVTLCQPYKCQHCHVPVNHLGLHGLSCRKSQGKCLRHTAINDIINGSFTSTGVPSYVEPSGICLSDGKRPNGATIVPWKTVRVLVWDTTCADSFDPPTAIW